MAKEATWVTGVDISEEAVLHAGQKYIKDNLVFKSGSTSAIPLKDNSVDVVVSFETLEHHDEHDEMMVEINRVLTPGGLLIISSPEKSIYKSRDPENPYHIKELTLLEFSTLLERYFSNVEMLEQKFVIGSLISSSGNQGRFRFLDGDFDGITDDIECDEFYNRPFFNLALASNEEVPTNTGVSLFNGLRVLKNEQSLFTREKANMRKVADIQIEALKKSNSYTFGHAMLKPLSILKRIMGKQ